MNKKLLSLCVAAIIIIMAVPSNGVKAATVDVNYATQVITALGIIETDDTRNASLQSKVTRAQYAQMLVKLSTFKDTVSGKSNTSLFKDVNKNYWAAGYIKVAITNQWMSGYLNGKFKPGQAISLQEAVNGIVKLLGYSNSDLTGNKNTAKISLYYSKNLDKNITRTKKESLTRLDCVNLFYNTLISTTKEGAKYATTLGYTLDSGGEVDYLSLVNKEMEGPIVAGLNWTNELPFAADAATYYRNGSVSSKTALQLYDVLYYSKHLKTVWAYSEKVTGTLKTVSPNRMSPTEITMGGNSYKIENQKVSYQFSTLGGYELGEVITILLGKEGTIVGVLNQDEYNESVGGIILDTEKKLTTGLNNSVSMSSYATIVDSYGREFQVEYTGETKDYVKGQVVLVTYGDGKSKISTTYQRYTNPISGKVNESGSVIGTYSIAKDARILDIKESTYIKLTRSRLAGIQLYNSNILYYSLGSNGEIEELILDDVTGDLYSYGVLTESNLSVNSFDKISATYCYMVNGVENTSTVDSPIEAVRIGASKFLMKDNKLDTITNLTSVLATSIEGIQVKSYQQTITMADEIQVYYLKDSKYHKTTLSSVSDLSKYYLYAYYDEAALTGGRIRVIIAQDR